MTRKILPALLAAGVLTFAACGDDNSDNESGASSGTGVDRAFAADMIPHHESAVVMAKIAQKRGESDFVKDLADDIARTQTEEIRTLRREDEQLDIAGVKRGDLGVEEHMKGMDDDPAMLQDAEPFDEAFLEMMIPHHEGAIAMSKAELEKGGDPELKTLAQDIIDAQQREIDEMRDHLGAPESDHGSGGHE